MSEALESTTRDPAKTRLLPCACLAIIVGAHAFGLVGFFGTHALLGDSPVIQMDLGTHYYRAVTLRESGGFPGLIWDPSYMAGYTLGGTIDIDNRLGELAVWALVCMSPVAAWNWTLFVLFLLVPLLLYFAGRQAELSRSTGCLAALLGSVLFWLSWRPPHPYLYYGMYGWVVVLAVLPLFVTSFQSLLERPTVRRAGVLGVVAAFAGLANALSVFYLPVLVGILLSRIRRMSRQHWIALLGAAASTFVIIAPFLIPVLSTLRGTALTDELSCLFRASAGGLGAWAGHPSRAAGHGILMLGVGGLAFGWLDRKSAELVLSAVFVTVVSLFAFLVPGFADMQPIRHLEAGLFLACIPAARVVARVAKELLVLPLSVRVIPAALAAILLLPGLSHWIQAALGREQLTTAPSPHAQQLITYLAENTKFDARILIENDDGGKIYGATHLLGYLAREIDRSLIGGPHVATWSPVSSITFTEGKLFRRPIRSFSDDELDSILVAYNIGTVVCCSAESVERFRAYGLPLAERIGPFAVYGHEGRGFVVSGPQAQARASYNKIEVTGATDSPTRLRWNFDHRWRTEPPLPLRAIDAPFNPVGFIEVVNGDTTDFILRFRP